MTSSSHAFCFIHVSHATHLFFQKAANQTLKFLPLARARVPRRRWDVALARLADLDERKLEVVASFGIVVRFDVKDAVPL